MPCEDCDPSERQKFVIKVRPRTSKDSPGYSSTDTVYDDPADLNKTTTDETARLYPNVPRPYDAPPPPPPKNPPPVQQKNGTFQNGVHLKTPSAPPPYNPQHDHEPQHHSRLMRRASQRMHRVYEAFEPKQEHVWMFRVALVQLLFAIICLGAGVALVLRSEAYQIYSGCWVSGLQIIAAVVGIVASRKGIQNLFTAYLVLGVLAFVGSVITTVFAMINWANAGTVHPMPHCIINEFVAARVSHIYQYEADFEFAACVESFKIGISTNTLLAMFAILQGLLLIASNAMCCTRLCICTGYPCPTVRRV